MRRSVRVLARSVGEQAQCSAGGMQNETMCDEPQGTDRLLDRWRDLIHLLHRLRPLRGFSHGFGGRCGTCSAIQSVM